MRSLDAEVRGAFLCETQSDDFTGEAKKNNNLSPLLALIL